MPPLLTVKNLSKIYSNGTQALNNISFSVFSGDFFTLIGANGAGKTTAISILVDLVQKSSGDITFNRKNYDTYKTEIKYQLGYVPQEINLNIFETVENELLYHAGYYGISSSQAIKKAKELMEFLDLYHKRSHQVLTLSGGMKRRLMIARALMHSPKLLFLDEPTTGIDVELRKKTWEFLQYINKQGTTIILTTHYLEEAEYLCNRGSIIHKGSILRTDTVDNLRFTQAQTTYTLTLNKQIKKSHVPSSCTYQLIDRHTYVFTLHKSKLQLLLSSLLKHGYTIHHLEHNKPRLEDAFLHIIKENENN